MLVDRSLLHVADSIAQQSGLLVILGIVVLQGLGLDQMVDLSLVGLQMLIVDELATLVRLLHSVSFAKRF